MQNIRRAEAADVDAIAELEKEIFSDAWTRSSIHGTFCQKQAFIVVSESEEKVNGYCIIYYALDEGEIARIAVAGAERSRGVGRRLLDYICNVCREKGIGRLLLDVRESNVRARKFYQNYGFKEDGVRKNFYDNPREHAVLMSREIG